MARTSALRQMIDDGVSLSAAFNAEGAASNRDVSDRLGSGRAAGRVSAVGLNPITLEQKLAALRIMINKGQIVLPPKVSMETIKDELKKPENDGLAVRDLVTVLTAKKLLQPKAPVVVLKPKNLAFAFAPAM